MTDSPQSTRRYEIRVAGVLSDALQDAFEGMTVQERPAETAITGPVLDESQLHGMLVLIQNLGLHVVSVQQLPVTTGSASPD